ncbi:MAG: hypothetical protein O7173_05065 [Wolbachia endosymbiont of Nomada fabriciana]|uniref:hypothetical protein n=4 Tax=Wolbachia TaxID=953 RepID=UPI00222081D8|nr:MULTISPECIES: hypothetical protein [unclassified Wolbachia]MDX5496992.1 hypothetical protein [Wolbachia endosymbiont of Nomada fabriciana]MDX5527616.1 hypothetical protein [Wolbachia endosymbiont of Andrena minutula]
MVLYFIIREMMNKNNVPYYIAGTLATFTLLASGVFAAAPYIGFLAPVAALSVGLPFIIGGAVFSAVAIALSYAAVSKNKTISEKEAQLSDEKSKVEAKGKIISEKVKEISEKNTQLANQAKEIEDKDKTISEKDREIFRMKNELAATRRINASQPGNAVEFDSINQQLTKRDFEVQTQEQAIISQAKGKFNSVGNKLKNIYDTMPSAEFAKDIKTASEKAFTSTKEAFISGRVTRIVKDGLKNTYDASIASVRGALNSVGSSLYSRIYGTKVSSPEEQFKREDGSKPSMQELTRLDYLNLEVLSSEQKQRANSLDYLNIDNVPKQPDHLNVDAAKSYLMSLSEDQDVFYDAESGDEKGTEISSPESQPTKEENGQGWFAWSLGKVKSAMTEVVVIDADVTKPYFAKVTKALAT